MKWAKKWRTCSEKMFCATHRSSKCGRRNWWPLLKRYRHNYQSWITIFYSFYIVQFLGEIYRFLDAYNKWDIRIHLTNEYLWFYFPFHSPPETTFSTSWKCIDIKSLGIDFLFISFVWFAYLYGYRSVHWHMSPI